MADILDDLNAVAVPNCGSLIERAVNEIETLRGALKPFADWDEYDETTHGFLTDPKVWSAAKAAMNK
jgi:hypothetical protein